MKFTETTYGKSFIANMAKGEPIADAMVDLVCIGYDLQNAINANEGNLDATEYYVEGGHKELVRHFPEEGVELVEKISKTFWSIVRGCGLYNDVIVFSNFLYPYCEESIGIPAEWNEEYTDPAALFGYVLRFVRDPDFVQASELAERLAFLTYRIGRVDIFNKAMDTESPKRIEKISSGIPEEYKVTLIVTGSKEFDDYEAFEDALWDILCEYIQSPDEIATRLRIFAGDCKGTDEMALRHAKEHHCEFKRFRANWEKYPEDAGSRRNKAMVNKATEGKGDVLCIGFVRDEVLKDNTKHSGTIDCVSRASREMDAFLYVIHDNGTLELLEDVEG